ncbi:MAG TPA: FkbM family methyltransferase [Pyrinomonadaceae bacterium]|nr:FkbM family methyltransferase [Pyrinomonadaceae bacterium]
MKKTGYTVKKLLPNRPIRVRILRGPLRGGRLVMNPRQSMRKILGLYEHELNNWLEDVLRVVDRVVDVGANDGYFTFGCAAAFRRLGKAGEIVAFEPQQRHFEALQRSIDDQPSSDLSFNIIQSLVGIEERPGVTTLDSVRWKRGNPTDHTNALVKIDVEGAEEEVLLGGSSWFHKSNFFLIEVHKRSFIDSIGNMFAGHSLLLDRVDQRPLPFLGRELRDRENWWLVSRLRTIS